MSRRKTILPWNFNGTMEEQNEIENRKFVEKNQ